MLGTLAVIFGISALFRPSGSTVQNQFLSYFAGGELSLSILSVSSIVLVALLSSGRRFGVVSGCIVYLVFILPLLGVSALIGQNPGFSAGGRSERQLGYLWAVYFLLHVMWFIVVLSSRGPDYQEEASRSAKRVSRLVNRRGE